MSARHVPILPLLCLVGACTADVGPPADQPIDQDMGHVTAILDEIGTIRFPLVRPGSVVPAELERPLAWRWSGDLDTAVAALAGRVGYQVVIVGKRRAISVRINRPDATAIDLFRELAGAAAPQADLVLAPRHHQVTVIHRA